MIKNVILGLFVTVILSGCAGRFVPPIENVNLPKQGKIGIHLAMPEHPKHTHIGTTIFNNFVKDYEYNWQLKEEVFQNLKKQIETNTSYKVVDLSYLEIESPQQLNFVGVEKKKWVFSQSNQELKQKLLDDGITAVLAISGQRTLAELNCSQYGCSEHYSEGYGLFTRSFLGMDRYYASSSFFISAELLTQPIDLGLLDGMWESSQFQRKNKLIDEFKSPKDFKALTQEELAPVKSEILVYFDEIAGHMSNYLNGNIQHPKTAKKSNKKTKKKEVTSE